MQANGTIDRQTLRLGRGGFELTRDGAEVVVIGRAGTVGRFDLLPTPGRGVPVEQRLVAVALAGQLAIRLAHGAA